MNCARRIGPGKLGRYAHIPPSKELVNQVMTIEGRCSGIPDCCIEWFVNVWMELYLDVNRMAEGEAYREKVPERNGYIPCPTCLASKAFSQTRGCPKDSDGRCACNHALDMLCDFPPSVREEALALFTRKLVVPAETAV